MTMSYRSKVGRLREWVSIKTPLHVAMTFFTLSLLSIYILFLFIFFIYLLLKGKKRH